MFMKFVKNFLELIPRSDIVRLFNNSGETEQHHIKDRVITVFKSRKMYEST